MSTMVSPMLHSSISHPHSPLNLSPAGSPSLRPTIPGKSHTYSPSPSGTITPLGPFPNPLPSSLGQNRSYARQPTQRPYQSALVARASVGGASGRAVRPVQGDSLKFANLVMGIMESRGVDARKGGLGLEVDGKQEGEGSKGTNIRASKSVAGSLAGSYEMERAELIVDVPVWSPGCFQDLSTLHALRDTTLSHTHSLLAHFMAVHGLPASYRLLARSAVTQGRGRGNKASNSGWGCIRLAPYASPTTAGRPELKPKIRRSSMDLNDCRDRDFTAQDRPHRSTIIKSLTSPVVPMIPAGVTGLHDATPLTSGMKTPEMRLEEAIADDDEPVLEDVQLKTGYRSGSVSDDEDEEDADTLVAREVEKRGAKEGTAFLMTLFGGPALILV